jgi:hypothetical protein
MSNISVLVIAYNKPDLLEATLHKASEFTNGYIYVHLDGPKADGDSISLNRECAEVILKYSQKQSRFKVRFQNFNLGGRNGVLSAINWFFESEDFGIILEEDIDFNFGIIEFTEYARKSLDLDSNIFGICFFNPIVDQSKNFILHHWLPWGWATSREQWESISNLIVSPELEVRRGTLGHPSSRFTVRYFLNRIIGFVRSGKVQTWDAQVHAVLLNQRKSSIFPAQTLTKHLGIRPEATHADLVDWWSHLLIGEFKSGLEMKVSDKMNRKFEKAWRMNRIAFLSDQINRNQIGRKIYKNLKYIRKKRLS